MKTTQHILYIAAFILVAAALTTGCAKERLVKKASGETHTVTLEVGFSDTRTTITQSETENKLPVVWKTGDKVIVAGATDGYLGTLTLTGGAGDKTATFGGELGNMTESQKLHVYYIGDTTVASFTDDTFTFDISTQKGTLEEIAKRGHIAHAESASTYGPEDKTITVGTMENMNAVILFDLSAWTTGVTISGTYNKAVLDLKTGKFNTTDCKGEIVIPAANCSTKTYVTFIPDVTAIVFQSGSSRTPSANNSMEAGKFYSRNGDAIKIPTMYLGDGALGEMFSVGPKKKVYFSRGNLWTNTTAGHQSWSFETEQYYYPTGKYDSTHVSRFYWSNEGNYGSKYKYVAPTSNVDWGVPYCNANGLAPGTWRTLSGGSNGEWEYLLDKRTGNKAPEIGDQTDARYAEVKVNDIPGVLVFPDVFTWPSDVATIPTNFNTYSSTWNNVNYSTADFAKLETAGCLFLPAAGYRGKDSESFIETCTTGYYWSSTFSITTKSYELKFNSSSVDPSSTISYNYCASSVRLVKDAKDEPLPRYIDDNGDHGPGIEIEGVIWAPVNCGYDATNYKYGKMYQFGRAVGGGYKGKTSPDAGDIIQTAISADFTSNYNSKLNDADFNAYYYINTKSPNDWYVYTEPLLLPAWPLNSGDTGYREGITANPCPSGWRVPTSAEFGLLLGGTSLSITLKSGTGIYSGMKGYYLNGTSSATETSFPVVFLPAAGIRTSGDSGKNGSDRDSQANYWASETRETSGVSLDISVTNASIAQSIRYKGLSVRCVYDANTLPLSSTVTANSFTDRVSW